MFFEEGIQKSTLQHLNNSVKFLKISNHFAAGRGKIMKSIGNMGNIMNQAKKIQERLASVQEEMALKTIDGSAGGGMVTVTANGRQEIVSLKIEPEVVNPEDIEMLQDLVQAAVNDALRKSQEMVQQEMSKITGGLKIPGLF